jgi:DNA polymerase epsilon subunit 1
LQNAKRQSSNQYVEFEQFSSRNHQQINRTIDPLEYISDMKEYDVPYHMRVAIDCDIRVGAWFSVTPQSGLVSCLIRREIDKLERCDLRVLAFDIECEKAPLKFPDASKDRIYMISYMMSGRGYLLINREVVSEDVQDFEYTPTSKYPGPFEVCNEPNEEIMLRKFIHHIQTLKPHVISTYNGDFFDWPFLETRLGQTTGLSLYRELGIRGKKSAEYSVDVSPNDNKNSSDVEYVGRCIVHLDAFCWVKRDSYLPQGNQGLKAVTKYKLGYDPVEVDPEDMLRMAQERPTHMASYSVSDAVATYYLYDTYVHNFIFSLSTIIPMGAEEVLRKGSGTLCEALLMVEAYKCGIICPNKQTDSAESFHNGHFLDSETYIGGHVECLEAGVFRADIPCKFSLIPSTLQNLIDRIDRDLVFALENENDIQRSEILNYDEVRQCIVEKLEMLRDFPRREEPPLIYHLDVGAMYPNIILTNRLQPNAMVTHNHCASCDFNLTENDCRRKMTWTWRGEYFPPSLAEYQAIKKQLEYEKVGDKNFTELSESAQISILKSRLKSYSNRVYKRSKQTEVEDRINTVCMRENPFYVNTVRAFRDRRYEYKLETKKWKTKKNDAEKNGDFANKKIAEDKEVLMDSLQLAHKCILNSFYGYVMRKGARWRSMEMAGIVTYTGAELIKQARELVENVGRPLELDTDGIWCILPKSFPQEFKFKINRPDGTVKFMSIDYPCAMLNADVHDKFTNHQYQDLVQKNSSEQYASHSECSIYFELDGPYKAMILPASPEEGKLLKKKYVVFNFDDSIAELKGFEIKRRGELELIKIFQGQVFDQFLNGTSLRECYDAVASVANKWLDILFERGRSLHDDELMELISEKKTISKTLEDYEGRKATSLTTAARLADFLGEDMVKDKGLNCNLIISCLPHDAPVAERAIPVAIFAADESIKKHYLRKWTKDPTLDCSDFRNIIDWSYYIDRLGKVIQKIITIPAGMQGLLNPCPRIDHPIWLRRKLADLHTRGSKQLKLTELFKSNSAALSLRGNDGASFRIHSEKASESSCRGNERTNKAVGSALSPSPAGKKRPLSMGNNKPSNIDYDQFENIDVNKCGDISSNRVDFGRQVLDIEDIAGLDDRGTFGIPLAHKSTSKQNSINNSTSLDQEQVARDSSNDTESEITKHIIFEDLHDQSDLTIWLKNRKMSWRNKRLLKQTIKKGQILKFSGASR